MILQSVGVAGHSPGKTTLTSGTNHNFGKGVLKPNLRFDNLLGLRELTGSSYTHGYSLLQKKKEDESQAKEEAYKVELRNV